MYLLSMMVLCYTSYNAARTLTSTLFSLNWKNNKVNNIGHLFSNQLTEEGICFTFNSLSQDDIFTKQIDPKVTYIYHNRTNGGWTLENGYRGKSGNDEYPERTSDNGGKAGMSLYLFTPLHLLDFTCGIPVNGFKIILHSPVETPRPNHDFVLTSVNSQHVIVVTPILTTTSENLLSMNPRVRKCYFSHEKTLRLFKTYTQNNCKIECQANISKYFCGCVPFYTPREPTTAICGIGKMKCVSSLQSKMMQMEIKEDSGNSEVSEEELEIFNRCDCLPSCSNLQFTTESSHIPIRYVEFIEKSGIVKKEYEWIKKLLLEGKVKVTQVDIFFKESQFLALHRSELFGLTDFFANTGGLLGLFLGFSVLSIVEMIYFLTVKTWSKIRTRNEVIDIRTE